MRSGRLAAAVLLLLAAFSLLLAARSLCSGLGLQGHYYLQGAAQVDTFSRVDREITTRALSPLPRAFARQPFRAHWDGFVHVDRPGRYVFQLAADDGAWLEIDGRLVIDNGGGPGPLHGEGSIDLAAGLHLINLRFFQLSERWQLDLRWGLEGERREPLKSPALLHVPLKGVTYTAARLLYLNVPYVPFLCIAAVLLLSIDLLAPAFRRLGVSETLRDPALVGLLCVSLLLNAVGIFWGINRRWAPDEILPSGVLEAIQLRFANGWHGPYPPFHYYILGLAYLPFLLTEWFVGAWSSMPFHLLNRSVSLVMAAGVVTLTSATAKEFSSRRGGLLAALLTALLLPFVYYAKTSNLDVPYLFWFSWAMLFYARIIVAGDVRAYAGFAIAAALATATKDQAYGFFVGPFLHGVVLRYFRLYASAGRLTSALLRDVVVPRAGLLALLALALAYNLPLNWSGFTGHVAVLTVNAGDKYRMFAATLDGQFDLLRSAATQVRFAFGWPAFLLVAVAVLSTARHAAGRTRLWLFLPMISYYCLFLVPVAIVFDRFMLGVCILLAIIAGCEIADWMRSNARLRTAAVLCVGVTSVYSASRAVALDRMMLADSRYYVEDWMATRVPMAASVLSVAPRSFLPWLDWSGNLDAAAAEPADAPSGAYIVFNGTYAERFSSGSREGRFYERIRKGGEFSVVLRHRSDQSWFPLSRDPIFVDIEESQFTNLDKINPLIEIYRRE
jgi:hypothetical protein